MGVIDWASSVDMTLCFDACCRLRLYNFPLVDGGASDATLRAITVKAARYRYSQVTVERYIAITCHPRSTSTSRKLANNTESVRMPNVGSTWLSQQA